MTRKTRKMGTKEQKLVALLFEQLVQLAMIRREHAHLQGEISKHERDEQKLAKRDELISRLLKANAAMAERRNAILPAFEKTLVSGSRDPARLAKTLSEKYPSLRVMVSFEDGTGSAVSATPLFYPFALSEQPDLCDIEYRCQQAEELLSKIDSHWPSYAEVVAYAKGYEAAGGSFDTELRQLREENKRLKSDHEPTFVPAPRSGDGWQVPGWQVPGWQFPEVRQVPVREPISTTAHHDSGTARWVSVPVSAVGEDPQQLARCARCGERRAHALHAECEPTDPAYYAPTWRALAHPFKAKP